VDLLKAKQALFVVIEKYWANFNVFKREEILINDWNERLIKEIKKDKPRFSYKEFISVLNDELEFFEKMPNFREIILRIEAVRFRDTPVVTALPQHKCAPPKEFAELKYRILRR